MSRSLRCAVALRTARRTLTRRLAPCETHHAYYVTDRRGATVNLVTALALWQFARTPHFVHFALRGTA